MNKSTDPDAPKIQEIVHAPHGGRNIEGEIVADSIESAGQGSEWESTSDLNDDLGTDATKGTVPNDEGYSSGPDSYGSQQND